MKTATLQGLLGRKMRTALTALSIVLGVAMVSGTFILTDTMKKAFDDLFQGTYKNAGAVISGKEIVKGAAKSTVPESLQTKVAAQSDVESASGAIFDISGTSDFVKLIDRNGKQLGSTQQPNFGWGFEPGEKANPTTLKSGKWAVGPSQVVIDAASAKKGHYKLGDKIGVAGEGPQRTMTVSGIARFGSVDSIGGATFAVFDVPTAQKLLRKEGQFDVIYVTPKSGVSQARGGRPGQAAAAGIGPDRDRRRRRQGRGRGGQRRARVLPVPAARVRRDRPARRLLRHLQHAVDDGQSARARAGHAAHARRLAQAGVPLGAARRLHHRAVRGHSGSVRRPADRQGSERDVQGVRDRPPHDRHRVRREDGDRLAGARCGNHGAGHDLAGSARDPRAADRGRARGRGAAAVAARQEPYRRADRARDSGRPAGSRPVRRRPAHGRRPPAGRSRDASSCSSASA